MGYALHGADTVVSFLQQGEDYCRQKEITPAHLATLPAPAPPQASPQPLREADAEAIRALRERYPVIAAYAGHLNDRHLPELLVGAAGSLREQGIAAVIPIVKDIRQAVQGTLAALTLGI